MLLKNLKVFKFGGASVKDAESVRNLAEILAKTQHRPLVVVVSAMGKTTNALENYLGQIVAHPSDVTRALGPVKEYHLEICRKLFPAPHAVFGETENLFCEIADKAASAAMQPYAQAYDQVVGYGEILSTLIISHFLALTGIPHHRLDARQVIRTDSNYRRALVDEQLTSASMQHYFESLSTACPLILTQGFIGSDATGHPVTLGREGSDYTAALFAGALNADSVTLWKDVPGVMSADPALYPDAIPFHFVSYREAVELTYYGASVIHPKTIKPLENQSIPLYVKSFLNPSQTGTRIGPGSGTDPALPSRICKPAQALISLSNPDLSFITPQNLADTLAACKQHGIAVNLIQNSALTLSVCVDDQNHKTEALIALLQKNFNVRYNRNLSLITIRHYSSAPDIIGETTRWGEILLEQRSRLTAQFVLKNPKT